MKIQEIFLMEAMVLFSLDTKAIWIRTGAGKALLVCLRVILVMN
jgi:hypothetical protein